MEKVASQEAKNNLQSIYSQQRNVGHSLNNHMQFSATNLVNNLGS